MSEVLPGAPALVREAVGCFHHWQNLQAAVDELLVHGFDRAEISLLAGEKAIEQKLGHVYQKVTDLEDDPETPRIAFVGRDSVTEGRASAIGGLGYIGAIAAVGAVVASGGALAWTIVAALAAGGGGAALGTVLARALGRGRAKDMEAQISKGGLLLWVRTRDAEHERRALATFAKHGAEDAHVLSLAVPEGPAVNPLGGFQPDPFLPQARL
jgi:hypothetical protein